MTLAPPAKPHIPILFSNVQTKSTEVKQSWDENLTQN